MITSVYLQVLKNLASHAIASPHIEWRHHGIGVLQGYLHEGDSETRLHVWHPSLVIPGFTAENGLVHDHRFGFTSYVLHGAILNEEYTFSRFDRMYTDDEAWIMQPVKHARKAMAEDGSYHSPLHELTQYEHRIMRKSSCWYSEGEQYRMSPRQFHLSRVNSMTVTVVMKHDVVDGPAVIARKKGVAPIHAFGSVDTRPKHYVRILSEAGLALGGTSSKIGKTDL